MSIFKQYKTDANAENNGVRVEKGSNEDNSKIVFILARAGKSNTGYKLAFERATKPHKYAIQKGTLDEEISQAIVRDVFCGHVLKGWENVRDENGVDIPFSVENAKKLMVELPDLYEELSATASDNATFLDANREASAKN